jgi:hypothetical protein
MISQLALPARAAYLVALTSLAPLIAPVFAVPF